MDDLRILQLGVSLGVRQQTEVPQLMSLNFHLNSEIFAPDTHGLQKLPLMKGFLHIACLKIYIIMLYILIASNEIYHVLLILYTHIGSMGQCCMAPTPPPNRMVMPPTCRVVGGSNASNGIGTTTSPLVTY